MRYHVYDDEDNLIAEAANPGAVLEAAVRLAINGAEIYRVFDEDLGRDVAPWEVIEELEASRQAAVSRF